MGNVLNFQGEVLIQNLSENHVNVIKNPNLFIGFLASRGLYFFFAVISICSIFYLVDNFRRK